MTLKQIRICMASPNFTKAEKDLLACEYPGWCFPSNFVQKLYELIYAADDLNRQLIALGFPEQVGAVIHWTQGNLAQRFEEEKA